MTILIALLGALARVWYGADDLPKLWQNRGLQTAFMMLLFVVCFADKDLSWFGWCMVVVATCWMQFQYWSRGHGAPADIGRDKKPSEDTIRRYNERWYHIPCDWLFDKIKPEAKYGFLYDFIYMTLRYTCPMLPMMIFDWRFILVGLSIAPIYAFCQTLQEREPWVFEKKTWYWRRGWSLAEILSGFVTYGSCYLLGL